LNLFDLGGLKSSMRSCWVFGSVFVKSLFLY